MGAVANVAVIALATYVIGQGLVSTDAFTPCESAVPTTVTYDTAGYELGAKARAVTRLTKEEINAGMREAGQDFAVLVGSALVGLKGEPPSPKMGTFRAQAVADQAQACAPAVDDTTPLLVLGPPSPGSGPGAWGGYSNGQIPTSAMVSVGAGHWLEPNAGKAFLAMNEAYRAETGSNISITDSYRSYEGQLECTRTKGDMCARPGFSNHGWGKALDLGSPSRTWVTRNGPRFGWILPGWAQPGGSKPEPWHHEYVGTDAIAAG
jgi:hypothetical protein